MRSKSMGQILSVPQMQFLQRQNLSRKINAISYLLQKTTLADWQNKQLL